MRLFSMKRYLPFFIVGTVALVTLASGALLYRAKRLAALASEAASLQGRFWEMHDLLYREQPVWSKAPDVRVLFSAYAGMLGLNIDRFKKDMESEQAKARVKSDEQQALALGLANTPTI